MTEIPFTRFMDMHSGGGTKEEPFENIYIQAPEDEAKIIFYNRFGHNPDRVSCTCCGEDYSISEHATLGQSSAHERNCDTVYFWKDTGEEVPEHCYDPKYPSLRYLKKEHCDKAFHGYVERDQKDYHKAHTKLEDYIKQSNVMVISHDEIKDDERHVPSGFIVAKTLMYSTAL